MAEFSSRSNLLNFLIWLLVLSYNAPVSRTQIISSSKYFSPANTNQFAEFGILPAQPRHSPLIPPQPPIGINVPKMEHPVPLQKVAGNYGPQPFRRIRHPSPNLEQRTLVVPRPGHRRNRKRLRPLPSKIPKVLKRREPTSDFGPRKRKVHKKFPFIIKRRLSKKQGTTIRAKPIPVNSQAPKLQNKVKKFKPLEFGMETLRKIFNPNYNPDAERMKQQFMPQIPQHSPLPQTLSLSPIFPQKRLNFRQEPFLQNQLPIKSLLLNNQPVPLSFFPMPRIYSRPAVPYNPFSGKSTTVKPHPARKAITPPKLPTTTTPVPAPEPPKDPLETRLKKPLAVTLTNFNMDDKVKNKVNVPGNYNPIGTYQGPAYDKTASRRRPSVGDNHSQRVSGERGERIFNRAKTRYNKRLNRLKFKLERRKQKIDYFTLSTTSTTTTTTITTTTTSTTTTTITTPKIEHHAKTKSVPIKRQETKLPRQGWNRPSSPPAQRGNLFINRSLHKSQPVRSSNSDRVSSQKYQESRTRTEQSDESEEIAQRSWTSRNSQKTWRSSSYNKLPERSVRDRLRVTSVLKPTGVLAIPPLIERPNFKVPSQAEDWHWTERKTGRITNHGKRQHDVNNKLSPLESWKLKNLRGTNQKQNRWRPQSSLSRRHLDGTGNLKKKTYKYRLSFGFPDGYDPVTGSLGQSYRDDAGTARGTTRLRPKLTAQGTYKYSFFVPVAREKYEKHIL